MQVCTSLLMNKVSIGGRLVVDALISRWCGQLTDLLYSAIPQNGAYAAHSHWVCKMYELIINTYLPRDTEHYRRENVCREPISLE